MQIIAHKESDKMPFLVFSVTTIDRQFVWQGGALYDHSFINDNDNLIATKTTV